MRTALTALAVSLLLAMPAVADDAHHPGQEAAPAAAQPAPAAPSPGGPPAAAMDCPMMKGGGMDMMGHADHEKMMGRMQAMEQRLDMMQKAMERMAPPAAPAR